MVESMTYRKPPKKVARIRIEGADRKGIIATITSFLFHNACNIEDIDQRILEGYLIMNMLVDYTGLKIPPLDFEKALGRAAASVGTKASFKPVEKRRVKNVAILVSREDHCALELLTQMKRGMIKGKPVIMIGNHTDLGPLAKKFRVPFHCIPSDKKKEHEEKILRILDRNQIDAILLARYMQVLSPEFVFRHEGRIINIHPSLLPSFPGPRAYHQAYNKGVEIVGVTAHFVTTDLDEGPIIAQDCFRVDRTADSVERMAAHGQRLEAKVLARAARLFLDDRLALRRGRVIDSRKMHDMAAKAREFYRQE